MVVTLINLFVTCNRDTFFVNFPSGKFDPFVESVVKVVTEAKLGPVLAVSNQKDVLAKVAELTDQTIHDSEPPDKSARPWKKAERFISRYISPSSLLASEGLLLVSPFKGVVSATRLKSFLEGVEERRLTVSAESIDRNRNPFWIRALFPSGTPESPLWTDININRLPTLTERSYYTDAFFEFMPDMDNIKGSQWLPKLLDSDGALVYIPSRYVPTTEIEAKDFVIRSVNGERDMHFLYRLGLLNIHPDEALAVPRKRGDKTQAFPGNKPVIRIEHA